MSVPRVCTECGDTSRLLTRQDHRGFAWRCADTGACEAEKLEKQAAFKAWESNRMADIYTLVHAQVRDPKLVATIVAKVIAYDREHPRTAACPRAEGTR